MKIYPSEKDIKQQILSMRSFNVVASSVCTLEDKPSSVDESFDRIQEDVYTENKEKFLEARHTNPHLYFGSAIFGSTVINSNDDILLPEETWKVRHTAIDTPYNRDHDKEDIVGHITGVYFLDENGNAIMDEEENRTEYFDIVAEFVTYSHIFPDFIKHLEEKALDKKTMVSLEAIMDDFDYGIYSNLDNKSPITVIKRNRETAFLTKKLRMFGGNGQYRGNRIGRVVRNFSFTGMADVERGANPTSFYVNLENKNPTVLNNVNIRSCINYIEELQISSYLNGKNMKTPETLEDALKIIAELKAASDKETVDSLTADLAVQSEKIDALTESLEKVKAERTEASDNLKVAEARVAELEAKISEQELRAIGEARIVELESLGRNYGDNRESKIGFFATLNEDTYNELLSMAVESYVEPEGDENVEADEVTEQEVEAALETEDEGVEPAELDGGESLKKSRNIIAKAFFTTTN